MWAFSLSVPDEDRTSVWGSYSLFAVVQVASGLNSVIAAAIRAEFGAEILLKNAAVLIHDEGRYARVAVHRSGMSATVQTADRSSLSIGQLRRLRIGPINEGCVC